MKYHMHGVLQYVCFCCEDIDMILNSIQKQTLIGFIMNNKLLMKYDQDGLDSMMKYFIIYTLFYWSNSSSLPLLWLVCLVFIFDRIGPTKLCSYF